MGFPNNSKTHKKILHIAETTMGGVGTIINGLTNNSIETSSVICPLQQSDIIICEDKKCFNRTGRNLKSFYNLATVILKEIKINKYTTIHIHSSFAGVIVRTLFLLKLIDKNKYCVVFTPHCFSFIMNVREPKKKLYAIIERILANYNDYIVTNSNFEYQQAIQYGVPKGKLKIIYNGVNFDNMNIHPLMSVNRNNKINILFVGRFDHQKGYDYLIKIIEGLDKNKFFFNIVGDSVHDSVNRISSDNVVYHGWKKKEELSDYFANNDFLIMPSRWESFGLVAVEAQTNGLPVLANNTSSIPEVVLNNKTGILLDFNNIMTVIDFINAHDVSFWRGMRQDCRTYAHEKFHEDKMIKEYFDLYR
ncbi:glycosyltransferase family 4 protein [Raoultella terrigena]|uniref:glycosyltransferase family 4 protein n=1 Tax=Raoultella terrigena TaxID=577 RepID=UPI0038508D8D